MKSMSIQANILFLTVDFDMVGNSFNNITNTKLGYTLTEALDLEEITGKSFRWKDSKTGKHVSIGRIKHPKKIKYDVNKNNKYFKSSVKKR